MTPKTKYDPKDNQDLLIKVLQQDKNYSAERKQAYYGFLKETGLQNPKAARTFSLDLFFKNFSSLLTKHSLAAVSMFLLTLGGVSALATELLAPAELKPSNIIQQTNQNLPAQLNVQLNLNQPDIPADKICGANGLNLTIPMSWDCQTDTSANQINILSAKNHLNISFVQSDLPTERPDANTDDTIKNDLSEKAYFVSEKLKLSSFGVATDNLDDLQRLPAIQGFCEPSFCNLPESWQVEFRLQSSIDSAESLENEKTLWTKVLNSLSVNPNEFPANVLVLSPDNMVYQNEKYGFEFEYPADLSVFIDELNTDFATAKKDYLQLHLFNNQGDRYNLIISQKNGLDVLQSLSSARISSQKNITIGSRQVNKATYWFYFDSPNQVQGKGIAYTFEANQLFYTFYTSGQKICDSDPQDCTSTEVDSSTLEKIVSGFRLTNGNTSISWENLKITLPAGISAQTIPNQLVFEATIPSPSNQNLNNQTSQNAYKIKVEVGRLNSSPEELSQRLNRLQKDNSLSILKKETFKNSHNLEITAVYTQKGGDSNSKQLYLFFNHQNKLYELKTETQSQWSGQVRQVYEPEKLLQVAQEIRFED